MMNFILGMMEILQDCLGWLVQSEEMIFDQAVQYFNQGHILLGLQFCCKLVSNFFIQLYYTIVEIATSITLVEYIKIAFILIITIMIILQIKQMIKNIRTYRAI